MSFSSLAFARLVSSRVALASLSHLHGRVYLVVSRERERVSEGGRDSDGDRGTERERLRERLREREGYRRIERKKRTIWWMIHLPQQTVFHSKCCKVAANKGLSTCQQRTVYLLTYGGTERLMLAEKEGRDLGPSV